MLRRESASSIQSFLHNATNTYVVNAAGIEDPSESYDSCFAREIVHLRPRNNPFIDKLPSTRTRARALPPIVEYRLALGVGG